MKWQQIERNEQWNLGTARRGGRVRYTLYEDGWFWSAWVPDATVDNHRTYKTAKAAQKAVERWLEKHG